MPVDFSQFRWPSLAQDLAVMMAPGSPITNIEQIYRTYDIDEPTLRHLLTVPKFKEMFSRALADMRSQGTRAGHLYRAQSLAQALAEQLFTAASTGKMDAKDAIKLFELLLRSGGLLDGGKEATTVNVQTNVGVALPLPQGLSNPKLNHLKIAEATDV